MNDHPVWQQIDIQLQTLIQFGDAARKLIDKDLTLNEQEVFAAAIFNLKECRNKLAAAREKVERVMIDLAIRTKKK